MLFRKITLIGVGLLGGSLGLAARRRGLAQRIEGYVRRVESIEECQRLGAVDGATLDLSGAVADADLIVLCTPLGQMQALVERMSAAIKPGAVVTDVGSVKSGVVRALEPLVRRAGGRFVGSHPMAGTERAGVRHARADLFEGAVCVLTPTAATCAEALRLVTALWRGVGGRIVALPAELHDELASRASHLPHLLAAALVNYVLDPAQPANQPDLCASGFRDTTRIASGSPEMWRDIALANREHLARVLQAFLGNLREFQQALEKGDEGAIVEYFKQAKQRRDAWVARCWPPERASGG